MPFVGHVISLSLYYQHLFLTFFAVTYVAEDRFMLRVRGGESRDTSIAELSVVLLSRFKFWREGRDDWELKSMIGGGGGGEGGRL
jgi:hypothetical protein